MTSTTGPVRHADPRNHFSLWAAVGLLLVGCVPQGGLLDEVTLSAFGIAPTDTVNEATTVGGAAPSRSDSTELDTNTRLDDGADVAILSGQVNGEGHYELLELGPSAAGDRWMIEWQYVPTGGRAVAAIFDENMCLLARSIVTAQRPLTHVMRRDCEPVYLGVAAIHDQKGGAYRFRVSHSDGADIPSPRPQLVRLNFAGAADLTIGDRRNMSFGPFDAALLGERYADATDEIKQAILDALHTAYADYDVHFATSDDVSEPPEPYATIHFGYNDDGFLGLADSVDSYNVDPGQNAIVFIERFADYHAMLLEPAGMGQMIGNSAAHELGHLLGLYHTRQADSIMDGGAGSAWDFAGERFFGVADLDPEVFPIGKLDTAQMLVDTVGLRAN